MKAKWDRTNLKPQKDVKPNLTPALPIGEPHETLHAVEEVAFNSISHLQNLHCFYTRHIR